MVCLEASAPVLNRTPLEVSQGRTWRPTREVMLAGGAAKADTL